MPNQIIIKKPVITEKSLTATRLNRYTFEVAPSATKTQIKAAVAATFNVTVLDITTKTVSARRTRTGRRRLPSLTPKSKIAVVQLKSGDTIKLFETTG